MCCGFLRLDAAAFIRVMHCHLGSTITKVGQLLGVALECPGNWHVAAWPAHATQPRVVRAKCVMPLP